MNGHQATVPYDVGVLRVLGPPLAGLALLGLWIYCVLDVIRTDDSLVRHMPKLVWLALVVLAPAIGAIAWLALGRPVYAGWRPGDTELRPPSPPPIGPEDRPDWGKRPPDGQP